MEIQSGSADDAKGADPLRSAQFGWPAVQVEMIKEGRAVAEALPDQMGVIRLSISALRNLNEFLTPTAQGHLAKMLLNALGVVRRRGLEIGQLPWWLPGATVLSLEVTR